MKQKRQLAVLIILVLAAAGVWLWNYRGGGPSGTGDLGLGVEKDPPLGPDNPRPRIDLIDKARNAEYKSSGRNIFAYIVQAAPQGPGARIKPPDPVLVVNNPCGVYGPCKAPLPPPPKLPANLKFYGYGVVPNGTSRRAFFTDGEVVYVVSEGEILLNRYRILKIGNANLEFEEVSSGRIGTAPLEEQPGGSPPGGPSG